MPETVYRLVRNDRDLDACLEAAEQQRVIGIDT